MPRRTVERSTEEDDFRVELERVAKLLGWECYHTHDSRRSNPGWPDEVMLKYPRLLFIELKSSTGRVKPAQRWWLAHLEQMAQAFKLYTAGAKDPPSMEVYLWRAPGNWAEIGRILGVKGL